LKGELPSNFHQVTQDFIRAVDAKKEKVATRKASQNTLDAYAPHIPELLGGSADLTGSNLTNWKGCKTLNYPGKSHEDGNYLHYGVREFGMAAIMNGIYLHGGFRPFGGTFEIFSDYARNGIRMSALMKLPVIYVLTHDSIGLGEDGPTHQPVEQHASLRLIPNLHFWRPADAVETAVAWRDSIKRQDGPSALALSRQGLPHLERTPEQIEAISKGAYVLSDCDGKPEAIIIATGSEVHLAVEAAKLLQAEGRKIRVVSMPCEDVFADQDSAYKEAVLPSDVTARVAVEAGATDGWYKYVGLNGKVIGLDRFGESAPGELLLKEFGFTVDNVVQAVREVLTK
jgi:transketolase